MVTLKLNNTSKQSQSQSQSQGDGAVPQSATPAGPQAASPAPSTASTGMPKLKLKPPQPQTPATEQPSSSSSVLGGASAGKKQPASRKPIAASSKKRGANDDLAPPPKRIASGAQAARRPTVLKIKTATPYGALNSASPLTAGGVNKLKLAPPRKQSTARVKALTTHNVRREIPKRETGVGYDSEDSEREEDPAIQQGLILRMQPGEDADLLRNAIAEGKVGLKEQGGVEASIRFVTADLRRALVKVRGRMYAAALVDLPCIVESMKSWDKKGWWKVADVCQMLLVLGPVHSEAQIRDFLLPREVNKETMQYAHGLTPPMHYVRKRRFRKRVSHRQMENVEEEVERLLREDEDWERQHGRISHQEYGQAEWERLQHEPEEQPYDTDMDAEGEFVDTVEGYDEGYAETPQEDEVDAAALEEELANAMFEEESFAEQTPAAADVITESPTTMVDQAASFAAVENAMAEDSAAETPAETPMAEAQEPMTQDEQSSDEDESDFDDEADSPDVVDEDAQVKAAEKAQQMEEVADLEREIAAVRAKANNMANQLLKKREMDKLVKLEGDLKMKRSAFGLDAEE